MDLNRLEGEKENFEKECGNLDESEVREIEQPNHLSPRSLKKT